MKKSKIYLSFIAFAVIILISLFLIPKRDSGQPEPPRPQPNESTALAVQTYRLITQTYRDRNTKITFPQLTNFGTRSKQKALNRLIRDEALRVRHFYSKAPQGFSLEITYKIKLKSAKLLSIQYFGVGYAKGAAYPNNWFYTTNLNLGTGRRLHLKDLVRLDAGLVAKLKSSRGSAVNPGHQMLLADWDSGELLNELRAADPPNWTGGAATFSYVTKEALGISFSVIHALGDHAEFEMKWDKSPRLLIGANSTSQVSK